LIEADYIINRENAKIYPSFHLLDQMGVCIFASFNGSSATINQDEFYGKPLAIGKYRSTMRIPANFLNESVYRISAFLVPEIAEEMAIVNEVLEFRVIDTGSMRKEYTGGWIGTIRPKFEWNTIELNS
jgi:hypothetical protein